MKPNPLFSSRISSSIFTNSVYAAIVQILTTVNNKRLNSVCICMYVCVCIYRQCSVKFSYMNDRMTAKSPEPDMIISYRK